MDFCSIELYRLINVEPDAVSEFLIQPDISTDFWNISELPDKRVVRTRIVWVIFERMEPGNKIFFGGLLFITDRCCVLKRLIGVLRADSKVIRTKNPSKVFIFIRNAPLFFEDRLDTDKRYFAFCGNSSKLYTVLASFIRFWMNP